MNSKILYSDVNTLLGRSKKPDLVTDSDAIVNSIFNLFNCPIGTRFMANDYGTSIKRFIHEPIDAETAYKLEITIISEIPRWEPRIEILRTHTNVQVLEQVGYLINVGFKIRATGETRTLTYNFPVLTRTN